MSFKSYISYSLNLDLLGSQKLTVSVKNPSGSQSEIERGFWELYVEIADSPFTIDEESSITQLNVEQGNKTYSIERAGIWTRVFEILLELKQQGTDFQACSWFYVQPVRSFDITASSYEFFLFDGGKIAKARVTLTSYPDEPIPAGLLQSDRDDSSPESDARSFDRNEDSEAFVRMAYEKFYSETQPGRHYAFKMKSILEKQIFGRSLDVFDEQTSFRERFLAGLLVRELRIIRWLLVALMACILMLLLLR